MARGRGRRNRGRSNRSGNGANARTRVVRQAALVQHIPVAPRMSGRSSYASIYPTGCLHTLTEQERNFPEMNSCIHIMRQYTSFALSYEGDDEFQVFWDRSENQVYINNNLIRFLFFSAIKAMMLKDGLNWKVRASTYIRSALRLVGSIKFGSVRAFTEEITHYREGAEMDEDQARFVSAMNALSVLFINNSHFGMLYALNQITPCDCLKQEIQQEEEKLLRGGNQEALFFCHTCGTREERPRMYKMCRPCGMRCYCSRDCHVLDWRQGERGIPHKETCPIIQDIISFQVEPVDESVE